MMKLTGRRATDTRSGISRQTSVFLLLAGFAVALTVIWLQREFVRRLLARRTRMREVSRCRDWLARHPESGDAQAIQYKIARIYHDSLQDPAQAILEYKKFVQEYAGSALVENARYYMGQCWEELGNPERAREDYQKLIADFPGGTREDDARLRLEEIDSVHGGGIAV